MAELVWKKQGLTDSALSVKINQLPQDNTFKSLDFSENSLQNVPRLKHQQFESVEILHLYQNNIENINPDNLPPGIKWLNIYSNHITELDDITGCHTLEMLGLDRNRLTRLNPGHMPVNIQVLSLYHNQLTYLPDFSQCHQLRTLDLTGNQITDLDPCKLPITIKVLWMRGNKVTEVQNFSQHKQLEILDLKGNQIVKIYDINRDMSSWNIDTFHEEFFEDESGYHHVIDCHLHTDDLIQPPPVVFRRSLQSVRTYFKDMALSKRVRHSRKRYVFHIMILIYLCGILYFHHFEKALIFSVCWCAMSEK